MIKKVILTMAMTALMVLAFAQDQNLFISEYVEGTSNNKALEIYNGTGATVDLSNYSMRLASNGGNWSASNSVTLSGTLANNSVFVIANAQADPSILAVADITHTVTYYNGNDCVGLFQGDTLIDIIGVYQTDPGLPGWPVAGVEGATSEHTLIRKPTVTQGTTDWITGAGTNIDNSEWIVHPQNYFADLGSHNFNPGSGQQALSPVFDPAGGVYTQAITVSITSGTPGATIRYTTDGSTPNDASAVYSNPIPVSSSVTIKAIAFAPEHDPSYVATAEYLFAVSVANVSQLREQIEGDGTVYRIEEPVIVTFKQNLRKQKYVQDNQSGVLIDDPNSAITTNYEIGDAIVGLTGTIARYAGLLQLTPVINPGPPASTGNSVYVPVVNISDINQNNEFYQCRLVRFDNAHFVNASGDFATGQNYTLEDNSGTIVFRTGFYDVDYIGQPIPTGNFSVVGLVGQFNQTAQFTARALSDWGPVANDDNLTDIPRTHLKGNYPNPFNPSTTIEFESAFGEPAQIVIYNQKGQAVRHYDFAQPQKGINKVTWDGRNDAGLDTASGVYYFRLRSGSYSSTKKMILMK
ncbi:MAG: T9SS type A sorting domain-containing protein [Candidatus Cloacimonetes bacterium]|nr:T9SS type A sorting domain-containing protein [Candidatus Cloacimonadota bacterium]